MKKFLSMFLATLLVITAVPLTAGAEQITEEAGGEILLSMNGDEASDLVKDQIEETGVTVNDTTLIELVAPPQNMTRSSTGQEISSAVVVTNVVGNTVTKDFILPGYDDSIGFLNEDIPMTRAGYSIDYDWNANFTVRGTAVFNHLPKSTTFYTCYQPIGVYFTYQKNTSSADIRSIEVKYNCDGAVYTYPGYSSLGYNVEYEIPVKRISPAENTMYSKSDPYDTDKVIFTGVGGSYASQYLTFTVNDSGTEYRQTFRFYY